MPYQQVIKYRDSIDIVTCIGACGTELNHVPISQHNSAQLVLYRYIFNVQMSINVYLMSGHF